jgi:hypothetical protein
MFEIVSGGNKIADRNTAGILAADNEIPRSPRA